MTTFTALPACLVYMNASQQGPSSHAVTLLQDSEVCLETMLQDSHIVVAAVQQARKELLDLFD